MAPLIDIHTHIYPPSYISLLSSRTQTPYIHTPSASTSPPRLIILPSDNDASIPLSKRGRPINSSYSSIPSKLAFMKTHQISTSIISLANPWLDWLPSSAAAKHATAINEEMESICAAHHPRLYFFATLPVSAPRAEIIAEIQRLASAKYAKGCIMGTTGLGAGLDDRELEEVWEALARTQTLLFLHPHYGLPAAVYGPRAAESGHVLPLALGFPLETTIAFTRMYLAGIFSRHPTLKVLLAHAGGAMPFLAGRVHSCVLHERALGGEVVGGKSIWEVLKTNVWLDGVVYSKLGVLAAVDCVGKERVLWGTDHPFFPPIGGEGKEEGGDGDTDGDGNGGVEIEWESVRMNVEAVRDAFGPDEAGAQGVLGANAVKLLGLDGSGEWNCHAGVEAGS